MAFRMLPPVRPFVVLALCALLAGCGGSAPNGASKSDYEHAMAAVAPKLQSDLLKGRFALQAIRVPARARLRLIALEAELRTAIARLQKLQPPKDVSGDHAVLVDAYRALLKDFTGLNRVAQADTTDRVRVEVAKLDSSPAERQIGSSLQAIIAKGYDLGFRPGS
jgi:hypothetical protein